MNTEVHVSFQIIVFSRYVLGGGIAGSYDSPIFSFLRNLCTVSIVAAQIYIPTGNAVWEGSLFSVPSVAFVICRISVLFCELLSQLYKAWMIIA